jgi:prevent-host-death family protein
MRPVRTEGKVKTVGAYEAKTHLPRLLEEVAKGETITITKHGVPVATLVPAAQSQRLEPRTAIAAWRAYRKDHHIDLGHGSTIREMIDQGRAK